ncbi:MAG: hypothetical protein E6J90_26140 [Deltaproteobacteria bacterium]|nr:MAG: hypothetical protein E6J90_26140 [Deltaproteobacteria bacterium]
MRYVGHIRNAALAVTALWASVATAAPAHNVCVPPAIGVPFRNGPPQWLNWTGGTLVDPSLDDPRWLGATGHAFADGGALAPLQSRILWTTISGQKYLMMSFLVDLEGLTGAGVATPRDLFVGFRRPAVFTNGTPQTDDDEYAYIFQFHLTSGAIAGLATPTHCTDYNNCAETPGPGTDFWRVFVDRDQAPQNCTTATGTVSGPGFLPLTGSGPNGAPITWMTNPAAPDQDAVRYWKLGSGTGIPVPIENRWAVQIRMKVAATDNEPLEHGIPPSSTFWYQGTAQVAAVGGGDYAATGWWPRELTTSICIKSSAPNLLVHPQLGDATSCPASGPPCSPDNYSRFTTFSGSAPAGCDAGLSIDSRYIGAVNNPAAGTDFSTVALTTSFKATGKNVVIAQVVNLDPVSDVTAPILARFRLAGWGSEPWITPTEHGVWKDMRGAENGVCGTGPAPSCNSTPAPPPFVIPHYVDADHDNKADHRAAIHFDWTLGDDPQMGQSEFCKWSLKPPSAAPSDPGCTPCDCKAASTPATPNLCDDKSATSTDVGTRSTVGTNTACVSKRIEHECIFVELSAPMGGANFAQQSFWNNMNFDQMSVVSREALIDARQLPKAPNQRFQDIYLFVMPRNMPQTIPGGATDGVLYVRRQALSRAEVVAAPYIQAMQQNSGDKIRDAILKLGRRPGAGAAAVGPRSAVEQPPDPQDFPDRIARIENALDIMAQRDFERTTALLQIVKTRKVTAADLNEAVVRAVGPEEAAGIVPTLEIYPFYRPLGVGPALLPMTAFTVFLSHDGTMTGMNWLIDGAQKIGQNIYHLEIPTGYARKIQVRAQAITGDALPPPNPNWPCAGGCPGCGGASRNCGLVTMLGNTTPGLIAGVLVIRRRRKKQKPA